MWATKQLGPYGPKIAKSFRFDELGAEGDDTWLGGGAPRRKGWFFVKFWGAKVSMHSWRGHALNTVRVLFRCVC